MGNNSSKTIEVGKQIENAIRFGMERIEFEGDVTQHLEKVKPTIESIDHSIFWTTCRIPDPYSGTVTESNLSNSGMYGSTAQDRLLAMADGTKFVNYSAGEHVKTVVTIMPSKQLKNIPNVSWEKIVQDL